MRLASLIWITISVLLLIFCVMALMNTYVSIKYEIEPFADKLDESGIDRAKHLEGTVKLLWGSIIYLIINLFWLIRPSYLFKR